MSWGQWPPGPGQQPAPGLMPSLINPAPAVVPPTMPYNAADQWSQMQQQNWQQWAQWQQQYNQWQQQYGAEYNRSMNAIATQPVHPNMGMPPPLPGVEVKPPLPPEEAPANAPLPPSAVAQQSYSTYPTMPPRNNFSAPPPSIDKRYDTTKRQHVLESDFINPKRQMTDAQGAWASSKPLLPQPQAPWQTQQPPLQPQTSSNEVLSEAEKKFDKQFAEWEAQFNKWKDQNAGHPDKQQYREYEKKWESWRTQLLDRREQMRRKRLGLSTNASASPVSKTPGPNANQQLPLLSQPPLIQPKPNQNFPSAASNAFNKPPPDMNNEPLAFKPKESDVELVEDEPIEDTGNFLTSALKSDGIPGLDLVKDDVDEPPVDEEKTSDGAASQQQGPDLDAISKGIKNILGDQKLLSMLSLVSQNQNVNLNRGINTTAPITEGDNFNNSAQDQSNHSYDERSNLEPQAQRESVMNFDDQTRSSFNAPEHEAAIGRQDPNRSDNFARDEFNNRGGRLDEFNRNKFDFGRGNAEFDNRGGNLGPGNENDFNRPGGFNTGSNVRPDFERGLGGRSEFNRVSGGWDDYNQGAEDLTGGQDFNRAPGGRQDFNRAPGGGQDFNRAPGGGPDFNRALGGGQDLNRGPRNQDNRGLGGQDLNRGFGSQDNRGSGGQSFNRGSVGQDFNRGPGSSQEFNRGLGRGQDFNRGPGVGQDFTRGSAGGQDFNRGLGVGQDFDRGIGGGQNLNRGPGAGQDFNKDFGGGQEFNRGPRSQDFNRGPGSQDFNRGSGDQDFNRGPGVQDFNRGFGVGKNLNRGSGGFQELSRGHGTDFQRGQDFNKGSNAGSDFRKDVGLDYNTGPRSGQNFNRQGGPNFSDGPSVGSEFDRGLGRASNYNRGSGNAGYGFNKPPVGAPDFNRDYDDESDYNRGPSGGSQQNRGSGSEHEFKRGPPSAVGSDFNKSDVGGRDDYAKDDFDDFGGKPNEDQQFNRFGNGSQSSRGNLGKDSRGGFGNGRDDRGSFGNRGMRPEMEDTRPPFAPRGGPPNELNRNLDRPVPDAPGAPPPPLMGTPGAPPPPLMGRVIPPPPKNISFERKYEEQDYDQGYDNWDNTRYSNDDWQEPDDLEKQNCGQPEEVMPVEELAPPAEEEMWKPDSVIDYDHKTMKEPEMEILVEPMHMFDYRHKALNRIPYPERPKWLIDAVRMIPEFDPITIRAPPMMPRFESFERIDSRDFGRRPYGDSRSNYDRGADRTYREFESDRGHRSFESDRGQRDFNRDRSQRDFERDRGPRGFDSEPRGQRSFESDRGQDFGGDNRGRNDRGYRKVDNDRSNKFDSERSNKDFDSDRRYDRGPNEDRGSRNRDHDDRKFTKRDRSFSPDQRRPYERKENRKYDEDDRSYARSRGEDGTESRNPENPSGKAWESRGRQPPPADFKPKFDKPVEQPKYNNVTFIEDIINPPGRYKRPSRIVIILRGPPGSGKTFLAKMIKDREVENGGSAPRILSLDDYFMVEQEKEAFEDGKRVTVKEMVYEFEEDMEESYRTSLMRSFKKTITDGYFPFIVVDNVNDKVKFFGEMWSFAKQNGFQVYICQLDLDVQNCTKRNTHNRSEAEIKKCVDGWETTPTHHPILDATSLIQAGSIREVEMEEINSPGSDNMEESDGDEQQQEVEDQASRSKWDNFECSSDNMAKLDGVSKPLRPSRTMEEYLQLEDEWVSKPTKPGQKTVRWADLEERKQQEKMKAIGFVVGHTNWDRMMDPTMGGSALTQTKLIERSGRGNKFRKN